MCTAVVSWISFWKSLVSTNDCDPFHFAVACFLRFLSPGCWVILWLCYVLGKCSYPNDPMERELRHGTASNGWGSALINCSLNTLDISLSNLVTNNRESESRRGNNCTLCGSWDLFCWSCVVTKFEKICVSLAVEEEFVILSLAIQEIAGSSSGGSLLSAEACLVFSSAWAFMGLSVVGLTPDLVTDLQ